MLEAVMTFASNIQPGGIVTTVSTGIVPQTLLNAVTATTTGLAIDLGACAAKFNMAVTLAYGTVPTSISTQLQGSLDGTNWYNLGAAISSTVVGTTNVAVVDVPTRFVRASTIITGGANVVLTTAVGAVF